MPFYDVTFEDVGFTSRKKDFEKEPSQVEIDAFNAENAESGLVLVRTYASADDSVHKDGKEDGSYKVFVGVVVRQEYEVGTPDDYEHTDDEPFMRKAVERFFPNVGMEGNWEQMDYEAHEPEAGPRY